MASFSVALNYSQSLLLSTTRLYKHLIGKKAPGICGLQIAYKAVPSDEGCSATSFHHSRLIASFSLPYSHGTVAPSVKTGCK